MAQLLALCALCAALCALGGAASSIKFNITKTNIAASWQSSEYFNRCFRDTAVLEQWDYFHTTGTPDSHGNQWLLIKLSRAIRVQSVTVYGRAAEPSRAQNIEILLSDRLPPGLNTSSDSCYGTLSGSLSSLTQCGVTKYEQTQTHKVACSYSDCRNVTEYILLRKNVRNESDKYMNFQALEVEEVPSKPEFLLPPITDWKDGHSVSVAVNSSTDSAVTTSHRCLLETRDGNRSLNATQTAESDGSSHWRFTPQRGHNGEQIRCDVVQKLSGSLIFSQTVNNSNLEVKYKATVTWPRNIAPKKEGEALSFVVLTDGNPEPSSQCWLQLVSGA
uniref:Ig-like domain-containing protein n=1 Tax=Macrostomum lignano TaxID=282301 RepID=A0A1I8HM06_9PLAT